MNWSTSSYINTDAPADSIRIDNPQSQKAMRESAERRQAKRAARKQDRYEGLSDFKRKAYDNAVAENKARVADSMIARANALSFHGPLSQHENYGRMQDGLRAQNLMKNAAGIMAAPNQQREALAARKAREAAEAQRAAQAAQATQQTTQTVAPATQAASVPAANPDSVSGLGVKNINELPFLPQRPMYQQPNYRIG